MALSQQQTPEVIKKRAAFIHAAKGVFLPRPAFVLQRNTKRDAKFKTLTRPLVGYTVTKKLGNAVVRNRIRRRLRAAVKTIKPNRFETGHDYVFIARTAAMTIAFNSLCTDIETALNKLACGEGRQSRPFVPRSKPSRAKKDRSTRRQP